MFNEATVSSNGEAGRTPPSAKAAALDAAEILASIGEAFYLWDIGSDRLTWSANVGDVLLVPDVEAISTGRGYAQILDPENHQSRLDAVTASDQRDEGAGVGYRIQCCIRPDPGAQTTLWVEDTGRWFAGRDGKPARAHGIVRVINDRYEHESRLNYLARYDGLTGELNRHHLTEVLEKTLEDAIRFRSSCGFLLVAIDDLARINESYGFDIADQVIGAVAKRIRSRMRGKDTLGRFSGNKFGIVLTNCTPDDMAIAAERLLAGVRDEMVPTSAGPVAVTVTIGGVTAPRHARNVAEVLARAQEALDTAKAQRRGSFLAYQPNIEREAQRRENVRATDEIVAALNERRIFLAYEPVAAASDRQPAFYECLMRVRRTDGSLVGASEVVPVAERLGLVRLLDHRVLELVVDELLAAPALQASVNVSPASTTIRIGGPSWARCLRAHAGVAERLIVEITESAAIQRHRRNPRLRRPRQGSRLPHRHRRFRRRLHLVPQSAQARRRYRQDRRRLRAEHDPLGGRSRLRAHADRSRRPPQTDTVAEWVQDERTAKTLEAGAAITLQGALIGLASIERPWRAGLAQAI